MLDELGGHPQGMWRPAIDVMRREDAFVLRADLPGLKATRSRSKSRTAS
jgi:HSP20 family molecular chaperone IbpA